MKRVAILWLLLFACGRERPAAPPPVKATAPPPTVTFPATPPKAPDGSYAAAIDAFRTTRGFDFHVKDADVVADGAMHRPRPGAEKIVIRTKASGEWTAEVQPAGVVWMHAGKRVTDEPAWADRIWQRTTMFLDPQKKEGAPRLAGSDNDTNHYHFTDANSGAAYDVYVSKRDGAIRRLRVGTFDLSVD